MIAFVLFIAVTASATTIPVHISVLPSLNIDLASNYIDSELLVVAAVIVAPSDRKWHKLSIQTETVEFKLFSETGTQLLPSVRWSNIEPLLRITPNSQESKDVCQQQPGCAIFALATRQLFRFVPPNVQSFAVTLNCSVQYLGTARSTAAVLVATATPSPLFTTHRRFHELSTERSTSMWIGFSFLLIFFVFIVCLLGFASIEGPETRLKRVEIYE
jgi:hypothetical protein